MLFFLLPSFHQPTDEVLCIFSDQLQSFGSFIDAISTCALRKLSSALTSHRTLAVPHRTQILYLPDIAFITSFLDIKAGSRVIEAGTGSGSLSHSLARTVGAKGKVYSFEFHEERYEKARVEFDSHGLDGVIQLKHQDVYKHGFELIDEVDSGECS